jgi:hypothetical protein
VEEARDRRKARTGVDQFLALDSPPPKEGFDKKGRSSADLFHPLLHKAQEWSGSSRHTSWLGKQGPDVDVNAWR